MGVAICLQLDGVKGESTVAGHDDGTWIDVLSWNWGMTQSASAHISTGAGTGSADVKDLTITKYVDKASPKLMYDCFKGTSHKSAVLEVLKVMGDAKKPLPMVKITMSDTVFISSVHTGDPGENDRFIETLSLNFATVNFEYTGQKKDNTPDASIPSGKLEISKKF
jgi:type VI secretion system secreted protein Hcp